MSERRNHLPTYRITPESYTDLETTYYDLQEYQLLQSLTELGVDQFVHESMRPAVDIQLFAQFRTDILQHPQLLLVRKALRELKIMRSIDYADCHTVMKNVTFGPIEPAIYAESFRYAPRRHNA